MRKLLLPSSTTKVEEPMIIAIIGQEGGISSGSSKIGHNYQGYF